MRQTMSSTLIFLEKKRTHYLEFQWPEKQGSYKTHIWPKTPKKHHRNLVKPIIDLQKHKKTNPKPKIFPNSNLFFRYFQNKKNNLIWTLLIIWNNLKQKSTILMTKINANKTFLCFSLYQNPMRSSLLKKN